MEYPTNLIQLKQSATVSIERTVDQLDQLWQSIGLSTSEQIHRLRILCNNLAKVGQNTLQYEEEAKERLLAEIKSTRESIDHTCKDLPNDIRPPSPASGLVPFELLGVLQQQLLDIKDVKQHRIDSLHQLLRQQAVLCELLGVEELQPPLPAVPSKVQLATLQQHLRELEGLKATRKQEFLRLKRAILQLAVKLEETTEAEALNSFQEEEDDDLCLTEQHLHTLKSKQSDLEFRVSECLVKWQDLRESISQLWEDLDTDELHRETVLHNCALHTPSSIATLEKELEKMKILRLANIGKFIEKLKVQLTELWDACYLEECERVQSALADPPTELDLLVLESEVAKWRKYMQDHADVLTLVSEFEDKFEELLHLENLAKDPSRLFQTRGGSLLQEEKRRKRIKIELPRVQDKLLAVYERYAEHTAPLVFGQTVPDYIDRKWNEHEQTRQLDKNARKLNSSGKSRKGCTPAARTTTSTSRPTAAKTTPSTKPAAAAASRVPSATASRTTSKIQAADKCTITPRVARKRLLGQEEAMEGRLGVDDARQQQAGGSVSKKTKTTSSTPGVPNAAAIFSEVPTSVSSISAPTESPTFKSPAATVRAAPAEKKLASSVPRAARPLHVASSNSRPTDITIDYLKFEHNLRSSRDRLNSTSVDASLFKENVPVSTGAVNHSPDDVFLVGGNQSQ
ncbi:hypothetical protein FHG87_016018 [Trinorchestia longiramus]|nr:hypothetical protein FHG87_016018 [Trinorchestia longiramus]